jgi:hypothetical protein
VLFCDGLHAATFSAQLRYLEKSPLMPWSPLGRFRKSIGACRLGVDGTRAVRAAAHDVNGGDNLHLLLQVYSRHVL